LLVLWAWSNASEGTDSLVPSLVKVTPGNYPTDAKRNHAKGQHWSLR
jgi:hypothetical protein